MSHLIALVFDDLYKAEEARAALHRMGGEGLLEIDETAVLTRDKDGKAQVAQDENAVGKGRNLGHIVGIVAAAITGTMPFILMGTLGGALVGRLTDHGITNKFIKGVEHELLPGTSALIAFGSSDPERFAKIIDRLQPMHPKLIQSDLSDDIVNEINAAFQAKVGQNAA